MDCRSKPTKASIKVLAKQHGIKASWSSEWAEWTINGYHTDCDHDAMDQVNCEINKKK